MIDRLKNDLFKLYLDYRYRPGRLKRYIMKSKKGLEGKRYALSRKDYSGVRVAAIQVKAELYNNPFRFADKMEELVFKASREGAELLVFPEDNLVQFLGFLPGITDMDNTDTEEDDAAGLDDILAELGEGISIADILAFIGPVIKKISLSIFSALARKYSVYIMAGSGLFPGNTNTGAVYNISYLFGPDGTLLGSQKKNHLLPMEGEWGIKAGEELAVVSTAIGRLAFPVCMDATYFETFRIACQKEADIVIIPIANPDADYNYWAALRGIWGRVQESPVYGIKSAMVGDFLGFILTGQSGIYAPIPLTENKDGILAESRYHDREDIVFAELDFNSLREYRKELGREENRGFEKRYFPVIYQLIEE